MASSLSATGWKSVFFPLLLSTSSWLSSDLVRIVTLGKSVPPSKACESKGGWREERSADGCGHGAQGCETRPSGHQAVIRLALPEGAGGGVSDEIVDRHCVPDDESETLRSQTRQNLSVLNRAQRTMGRQWCATNPTNGKLTSHPR